MDWSQETKGKVFVGALWIRPLSCFLSPVMHGPENSKDDGNCNQQLSKYAGHFFFLIALGKTALQICQLIFFPQAVKAKLSVEMCGAAKILLSGPQHLEFKLLQIQGARKLFSGCSRQIKSCSLRLRVISRDSVRLWESLLSCESLASCYWNLIKEREMLSKIRVVFPSVYTFSIKGAFI